MTLPWKTLDRIDTPEGLLELRQRGDRDFLITIGGRPLMTSTAQRSEICLAQWGCAAVADRPKPRVLIGGLGMAFTLRAALDDLPAAAVVEVAELHPVVETWCRGPMSALTDGAVLDPRVTIRIGDVMEILKARHDPFDAILWDLYEGPHASTNRDPLYGDRALQAAMGSLTPQGTFGVWSEEPDPPFERRLDRHRWVWSKRRAGRGGRRHVIYLIRSASS